MAYRLHHWYATVELRKLLFEACHRTKKVDDSRPIGCVWNKFKIKYKPWRK